MKLSHFQNNLSKIILFTLIIATLLFAAYHGLIYLKHQVQLRFADVHSMLSDEEDFNGETFSDPLWQILAATKITLDEKKGLYDAVYSADAKEMEGKEVTVKGFMLPLEATEKFQHFLLSKTTPTCAFCPPGKNNEVIDIWVKKPTTWSSEIITIKGNFSLMNNQELGLFFKIDEAEII